MGGDGGPAVTVPAAAALVDRADLILVGDEAMLRAHLPASRPDLTFVHADDVVSARDSLADVLRRKPGSSMRQALLRHASGEADAVVSGGDTAALLALSRTLLDKVPGIDRPAICKQARGMDGPFWMLDLGANLDATPQRLAGFAHMGSVLARHAGGIAEPRVALLNIGTEAGKGPVALQEAASLLERDAGLNFVGYVEGSVLFSNVADVVVTDGFVGNITLKAIEGTARMAGHLLRTWLDELNPLEQAGLVLVRGKLERLRHELNPQRYNGASFVGLDGVVVKSHGSADVEGFRSAIEEAIVEVQGRVPRRIAAAFASQAPP